METDVRRAGMISGTVLALPTHLTPQLRTQADPLPVAAGRLRRPVMFRVEKPLPESSLESRDHPRVGGLVVHGIRR